MKKIIKKSFVFLLSLSIMLGTCFVSEAVAANQFKTGDVIEFGAYPQSKITNTALIKKLNNQSLEWISYGYHSGNNEYGSAKSGDWMKYADVTLDGETYRAVKFTKYRPRFVYYETQNDWSYQKENGYEINTVYWFKYEPVKWRVLNPDTGLVMCELVIDSQPYMIQAYTSTSSYQTSEIREWLNADFYNTVFSKSEQANINNTTISIDTLSGEKTIKDKIYLLSEADIENTNYGFYNGTDFENPNITLMTSGTDYAECQGLNTSTSWAGNKNPAWLLRTPADWGNGPDTSCVLYVRGDGWSDAPWKDDTGTLTYYGIRPAMCINLVTAICIQQTTVTSINYGDTLIIKSNTSVLPNGAKIEWCVEGNGVSMTTSSNNTECHITAIQSGSITVTAKIVDSNGQAVCDDNGNELSDSITLKINAGFWQKIISFFKNLFGINRVIY